MMLYEPVTIWSPSLRPVKNFDVGGASDAGIDLAKLRLFSVDDKDALQALLSLPSERRGPLAERAACFCPGLGWSNCPLVRTVNA